jgi:putative DNA primase/helicase
MDANEIHAKLSGGGWSAILERLGIDAEHLTGKHGPCPICGGKDRFRYDDRRGRGDYICGQCGAGDGFTLVQDVYGLTFREAFGRVVEAIGGLVEVETATGAARIARPNVTRARLTARARDLLRTSTEPHMVEDVSRYLESRGLAGVELGELRAHAAAEYWHDGQMIGRYPALIAPVRDISGEIITVHATFVPFGRKLEGFPPRKLLGKVTGRDGVAIRLSEPDGYLGIAEGIETALAARKLRGWPTWAALNTSLLKRWIPPDGVRVRVFADRDPAGLEAAARLMGRLENSELDLPPYGANDWAEALELSHG